MTSKSNEPTDGKVNCATVDMRQLILMVVTTMAIFFGLGIYSSDNHIPILDARVTENSQTSVVGAHDDKPVIDLNELHVNFEQPSYEDLGTGEGATQYDKRETNFATNDFQGGNHLPAGQHLLVDIKNVQADFLNSEKRLADAMVETVKAAGLTLLSYHCHLLIPAGVSCVGVLLESHISFHTWPEEGVITLDLFTCGNNPLLPVVPVLKRLFGIPRDYADDEEKEEVETLWSHEMRGFRGRFLRADKNNYLDNRNDLAEWVFSRLDTSNKKQIVEAESDVHRIDIWDILGPEQFPSYEVGMKNNLTANDPRWTSNELSKPNRFLFMNGVLQIMLSNEREIHEALVHPGMFSHPNPVHIAVVGGGDGAAIRELLKHNTVETITVIELDPLIIDVSREHLPELSDCSDIEGVTPNCFDDSRVNVIIEDARTWFGDRFGSKPTEQSPVEKFDVIILDAVEPQENSTLFSSDFIAAAMNSLSEDGIITVQIGDPDLLHAPKAEFNSPLRETFMQNLETVSGAVIVYEEAHTGFTISSSFLTVCKNANCRDRWYANEMVFDYLISERMRETKSKKSSLFNYDGPTQYSYQQTPRTWEEIYCRREPQPVECGYRSLDYTKDIYEIDFDEEDEGESESSFELKVTEGDEGEEVTALYALEDIPKGSYIMPSELAASFTIGKYTLDSLKKNTDGGDVTVIEKFLDYIAENGHESTVKGMSEKYVELGASSMIRLSSNADEVNIGSWMPKGLEKPVYSPVYERHMVSLNTFLVATRDIKEGEEIVKPADLW
jgi:S-adenosylmethionine decarboxylase proenzyme